MKKLLFMLIVCLGSHSLQAQNTNYNVVFDMTSRDTINQQSLVRQLTYIREANPAAKLEVVIYGQGLDLVIKDRSNQRTAVEKLLSEKNVSFKVCSATMKRHQVGKEQLVAGVEIVPDGIYEIITRQQQGWGYIKVAH